MCLKYVVAYGSVLAQGCGVIAHLLASSVHITYFQPGFKRTQDSCHSLNLSGTSKSTHDW